MNCLCPHCAQEIEATEEWLGYSTNCPTCGGSFVVSPDPSVEPVAPPSVIPVVKVVKPLPRPVTKQVPVRPPRPQIPSTYTPPPVNRGGGGGKFILLLLVTAAGAFCYGSFYFNEPPQQTFNRLVTFIKAQFDQRVPEPVQSPVPPQSPVLVQAPPTPLPIEIPAVPSNYPGEETASPPSIPEPTPVATPGGTAQTSEPTGPAPQASEPEPEAHPVRGVFVHPGLQFSHADLVRIKANALSGKEPWKSAFALFMASSANPGYSTSAVEHETIGHGQFEIRHDAGAASSLALKWYITGEKKYEDACIKVINDWSYKLVSFDPADNLSAATAVKGFGCAAEILQYEGGHWAAKDVAQFKKMLLDLLYPAVAKRKTDGMMGNQGIDAISAAEAIGIICDEKKYFDESVAAWYHHPFCGIKNFTLPSGQNGESGRDQPHSSGELMAADEWALFAWNQGVDLYSYGNNRLLTAFEYWCKYNLGNEVPFQRMTNANYTYSRISTIERGRLAFVNFERVYHHYVTLKNLPAPYLTQATIRMRPDTWGWGALSFYSGPPLTAPQLIPNGVHPITSKLNNLSVSVPGDTTTNSTQLTVELFKHRPSQMWKFTHLGMNVYSLINEQGKCTDIPGGSAKPKFKVQIHNYHDSSAQQWRLVLNPDGSYSFLNAGGSWGLTIADGNMASGAGLTQDYITATPNSPLHQEWMVGPPSSAKPNPPSQLETSGSKGKVTVTWAPNELTMKFILKRGTSRVGPYQAIASDVMANSYTDTTVVNDTVYYYVVSAVNQNGESSNSHPVRGGAADKHHTESEPL